ncbi:MAG: hypothetical protein ACK5NT_10475 [Pyrinomonadaceae bacterium]
MPPYGRITVASRNTNTSEPVNGELIEVNTTVNVNGTKIKLVSETLDGVSFLFEGEYRVKGNFYTLPPDAVVLSGNLTRIENGIRMKSTKVSFTWDPDVDCHC